MDSMKKRVRAFTEGAVVMACPVLLAVSLKKVDTTSEGNVPVRGIVSPLAAATLEAAILPFLFLCLSKVCLADLLFRVSKLLVHISALLLMALAYVVLLLISMKNLWYLVAPLVVLVLFVVWLCYRSVRNGQDCEEGVREGLQTSADFSAAVTALVFLGLEGLALEGQSGSTGVGVPGQELMEHKTRWLAVSLWVSFLTCLVGVCVMLLATVPPLITGNGAERDDMYFRIGVMEVLNAVLAIFVFAIVVLIAIVPMKENAFIMLVPPFVSFGVWVFTTMCAEEAPTVEDVEPAAVEDVEPAAKPASMELTKVAFTGFLAVSVTTFGSGSHDNYTHAFILLTGAAVISGLGWRLFTHGTNPSNAMVNAANIASFCAHLCVAAAVVPFAVMASNALKE